MNFRLLLLLTVSLSGVVSHAQIRPADSARIGYTQVMFECEQVTGADRYRLQLIIDSAGSSFEHCIADRQSPARAMRIDDLDFGRRYLWRYAGITAGHDPVWHGPYHFEIEKVLMQQLNLFQLSVSKNDSANAGGLISTDGGAMFSDRRGRPVLYLPGVKWTFGETKTAQTRDNVLSIVQHIQIMPQIWDMQLTPYGTITFLTDSSLEEYDIDGHLLWEKYKCDPPSEMGEDFCNHSFTRLSRSRYLALGRQVWRLIPDAQDTICVDRYLRRTFDGQWYRRVEYGTALEYDHDGHLIWSWSSQDYFDPYGSAGPESSPELASHVNSLCEDRNDSFVYIGFRDISRIVKIEKSSKRVVDSWGAKLPWGVGAMHHLDVHLQHDGTILDDGNIMVYNNNDYPDLDSIPSVLIFSQQPRDSGRILWRYDIDLPHPLRKLPRTGGNADLLKNGNILICTSVPPLLYEVTKSKKIVWQAELKPRNVNGYEYSHRLYRAHYVSSLYPCFFTYQTDRDTVSGADSKMQLTIFNTGSEADAYTVSISEPGIKHDLIQTATLAPQANTTIEISIKPNTQQGHYAEISISSNVNPDILKRRKIWCASGR